MIILVVFMHYNSYNVIVLELHGFLRAFLHSFLGVADGLCSIRLFNSTHSFLGEVVVDGRHPSAFTVIIETFTRISTRPIIFAQAL